MSAGAGNIGNVIGGLGNTVGGLMGGLSGASSISAGTALQVSSYRAAGSAAMSASRYNAQLINMNLGRQLHTLGRQVRSVSSSQIAAAGTGDIAISSKSHLAVINDTLSGFEREALLVRNSAKVETEKTLFEGRSQAAAFENQARAAQFAGDNAARRAKSQAISGAVGGIGNLFSSLAGA